MFLGKRSASCCMEDECGMHRSRKSLLITVSEGLGHSFNAGCRSMHTWGPLKQRKLTWRLLVARNWFKSLLTEPRWELCSCNQSLPLFWGSFQQLHAGSFLFPLQHSLKKISVHTKSLEKLSARVPCTSFIPNHFVLVQPDEKSYIVKFTFLQITSLSWLI